MVTAIEVTQGVQNLNNDVPLLAEKLTWVRVYVRSTMRDVSGVTARLDGTRDGALLPASPLMSMNTSITVRTEGGDRANLNDSFYFYVPSNWRSGTVTFRAEVNPAGPSQIPEANLDNNSLSVTLTFTQRRALCLAMVRIRTEPQTASVTDPNSEDIILWAKRAYPVPSVWVYDTGAIVEEPEVCWAGRLPYPCLGPCEIPEDSLMVLLSLWLLNTLTDDPDECANTHYYGMVHQSHGPGSGGAGYVDGNEAWGFMNTDSTLSFGTSWYWPHGGASMAHEIGHNLGRWHVDCGDPDDIDQGYPYSPCDIGPDDPTAYFGFDVASPAVIPPTVAADLMSYGHRVGKPRWPSAYTYGALFNKLSPGSAAAAPMIVLEASTQAQELLVATGVTTPTEGTAELSTVSASLVT